MNVLPRSLVAACVLLAVAALMTPVLAASAAMLAARPPAFPEAMSSGWTDSLAPTVPNPLTLDAALQFSRTQHPDLAVLAAAASAVRADSIAAGIKPFNPELELGFARGGDSFTSGTDGTLDFALRQEIELWGKRAQRRAAAAARLHTTLAALEARRQQIESHARASFRRGLFLQGRLATLRDLAALDREVVTSTRARVRDESVTPLTGRLTELDWLRVEGELVKAESTYRQALVELALALGGHLPDALVLQGDSAIDTLRVSEDALVNAALARRRETAALRLRVAERQSELRVTQLEWKPNLTVGAGLAWERQSFGRSDFSSDPAIVGGIAQLSAHDHLWQARVIMPLPLWQKNQGAQARAAAEVLQARRELDRFVFQTGMDARAAVRRFNDAAHLCRLYETWSAPLWRDLALVRGAYVDGRIPLESYLTQRGRLVDTLLAQLEAQEGYWDARGELEAVVGADVTQLAAGER